MNLIEKQIISELYEEGSLYSEFGKYIRKSMGFRVFKIPFNGNFMCPNWDGRLDREGCIYCPNLAKQFTYESFRPFMDKNIREQVESQIKHYKSNEKDKALVYLAFGTNTYMPLDDLRRICDEIFENKDVLGISVGTRPDCLPDEVLDLLGEYADKGHEIWLEIGQQTMHQHTLEKINRRHGVAECIRVVNEAHKRNIKVLFFVILGLPGETIPEMIETARMISVIGVDAVKIYPLVVMKGTKLEGEYLSGAYRPLSGKEYVNLVTDFIENLDKSVLIQRISKDCGLEIKVAPEWDTYRAKIAPKVEKELKKRNTNQGSKYKITLDLSELKPLI